MERCPFLARPRARVLNEGVISNSLSMSKKTIAFFAAGLSVLPFLAYAADIRMGQKPDVGSGEKITSNLYLAGGHVSSAATVMGDEIIAGGDILVNGPVSQDVLAAGGNITILGAIGGDVRIAGGNVMIGNIVKGDVVVLAGQTTLSGSSIGGDVIWGGGELRIDAPVSGNLQLKGGDVTINAPVKGSITFKGGSIHLGPKAIIEGNLTYTTPDKVSMDDGAIVKGKVTYDPSPTKPSPGVLAVIVSLAFLAKFLMTLACAMTLGLIFNRYTRDLVSGVAEQPLVELGRGFVTMVVLPVASVLLISTLVGIPFGILGFLGFAALYVYSWIITPILVGSIVHKWFAKTPMYSVTWVTILIGILIYIILDLIPILGWVVKFAAALMAIGGAVRITWDVAKGWL